MATRKPFTHHGGPAEQGGWTVVQTTAHARHLYGGYHSQSDAELVRDGLKRMDAAIKRKGVSYAIVNFGSNPPREQLQRNPARKKTARARPVRRARKMARGARVERTTTKTVRVRAGKVERTTTQRVRKTNPRARPQYALVAQSPRGARMRYAGTRFSNHMRPVLFESLPALNETARQLRARFGRRLRKFSLYAEQRHAPKHAPRGA